MGKFHFFGGTSLSGRKHIIGNGGIDLPIRKLKVVAQQVGVAQVNGVYRPWQFVLRANPHLHEDSIAGNGHDICRNATDNV